MKLIVHCGSGKAGSTALQGAFTQYRELLLQQRILYPSLPISRSAHHILTALFLPLEQVHPKYARKAGGRDKVQAVAREAWNSVLAQAAKHRPEVVVLSCEVFYRLDEAGFEKMRAVFQELTDDIEMVFYIREPAAQYLSGVQQSIKSWGRFEPPRPYRVRHYLEAMRTVFGKAPQVRLFSQSALLNGDVVQDFAAAFLSQWIAHDRIPSQRLNESISAEALSILDEHQRAVYPESAPPKHLLKSLREQVFEIEQALPPRQKPRLKAGLKQEIQLASTELLWLRQEYGVLFPEVDYTQLEHSGDIDFSGYKRVRDVIEIDPEREQLILHRLLARNLVTMKSVRDRWLTVFRRLLRR